MKCKINTAEWVLILGITVIVDIFQIILNLFAVGLVANRFIDFAVGLCLPAYFWLRGVSMKDKKRLLAFIGSFVLEEIPIIDILPLWSAEVVVVWMTVKSEQKIANVPIIGNAMNGMNASSQANQPLNTDGVRLPRVGTTPFNQDGTRLPSS